MPTPRRYLDGLHPQKCEHPWLALQHLAPFATVEEAENAPRERKKEIDEEKATLIRQVARSPRSVPIIDTYRQAFSRRYNALAKYQGSVDGAVTKFFQVKISGRLAAGLGNASVLENGLSLNHTFGLPYLPGTGLKGMASAMAHLGLEGSSWKRGIEKQGKWSGQGEHHKILFGTMDTSAEDAASGIVIFHDSWWDPEPEQGKPETQLPFQPDVMTPHHRDYNLEGKDWPNDWDSPNPVAFVTTSGTFRIALTGPEEWVEAAFEILEMAFQYLGFGAKTQIGYGRGELSERLSEEEKVQKQKRDKELADKRTKAKEAEDREKEAQRLSELPKMDPCKGIVKPFRDGGMLVARIEAMGWADNLTKEELCRIAPDIAASLWERLENRKEPKVQVTLVQDGSKKRVIALTLPA